MTPVPTEGQQAVYTGLPDPDGPAPGDLVTVAWVTGSGAWVRLDQGPAAGSLHLLLLEDLQETDNPRQFGPSAGTTGNIGSTLPP